MHYLIVSFSHKNSTIEIREKLSYVNDDAMHSCLKRLNESEFINETILISTCNRVEVLCSCNNIDGATEFIFDKLSAHSSLSLEELQSHGDIFDDSSAIHHIFNVASSLDSLVIGETQIAGQLKDAFRFSHDNGYCGKKLARTMKSAFQCAAKVRNSTEISANPVSIASVAVSKVKTLIDDLNGKKVLIIGVGEMSEISAKHLLAAGCDVTVTNRTKHKAEKFATEFGVKQIDFEDLKKAVNSFNIIFTATSSSEPIIKYDMIELCNFQRFWFDLAIPRDIEHFSRGDIKLYVIDDLELIVDENLALREKAARSAQSIIGREIVDFFESLATLDIEPVIKEIYLKAYKSAEEETNRVISKGFIPKEYEAAAKKMSEQVIKRFLHDMTSSMRNANDENKSEVSKNMMNIFSKSIDEKKLQRPDFIKDISEKK